METIRNRMPLILPEQSYASWLNSGLMHTVYLSGFFETYPTEEMEAIPISSLVNNPRHEDPRCIQPCGLKEGGAILMDRL